MTEYTETQAQADADALVARLESDPTFVAALKADPHAALIGVGIPEDTVTELVGVLSAGSDGSEVEGFGQIGANTLLCQHQSLAFQQMTAHPTVSGAACNPASNACGTFCSGPVGA
jgi:hypothetical protein